jgi:hypothetical protein
MQLAISSQDIGSISLALINENNLVECEDFLVAPEKHLFTLDQALKKWNVSLEDIDGVQVVTGPGSFTASRVSVTLANAIGFARNIRVVGLENSEELPLAELITKYDDSSVQGSEFVGVSYNRPAHITQSKQKKFV